MSRRMRAYYYAVLGAAGGLLAWQASNLLGLSFTGLIYLSDALVGALIGLSVGLRLVAGPVIGLLLAIPFGLEGPALQGSVTETAMPAAVTNTVLAAEYGLDSSLVTAMVFVGTILSPLTLTPLLVFLGN